MATIVGESGAWLAIVDDLSRRGQTVSSPRDLSPLLLKLEQDRPNTIDANRQKVSLEVEGKETRIAELANERGFFRRIGNWFRTKSLKAKIVALKAGHAQFVQRLDRTVERVRSLINSAELAGAEAELSVIQELQTLPSPATIFNDVRLNATRHIHYNGASLLSAQIDHVALTMAGAFVIETKYWSRNFVESSQYFDPFEQVGRASYLCYDLLRERLGKTRVRSIIVSVGDLPKAPEQSYTKVVRPGAVSSYIAGFRKNELTQDEYDRMFVFFERRTQSRGEW